MTDIEINRQFKLLEVAIEGSGLSSMSDVKLEPLIPGSLTLRQARLTSPSIKDSELYKLASDFSLLPEPHAWYLAHRPVPDYYLESVGCKHLPYILVFNDFQSKDEIDQIQFLIKNIATFHCNVFLCPTTHSTTTSLENTISKLKPMSGNIKELYVLNINNGADKLSLIKHAHHVVGHSIDEITDAISLGVSSFWDINSSEISLDYYFSLSPDKRLNTACRLLADEINDRLHDNILIETNHDLANALATNHYTINQDNHRQALSKPIMPLVLPSPSITKKQKRALALDSFLRKCRKFRESPKRFINDSKLLRFK